MHNQFVLRFATALTRLCEVLAGLLVGAVVAINLAQVVSRYVINDPLEWSDEVMRYSMAWVMFIGSSAAIFRGEHMAAGILGPVENPLIKTLLHYVILLAMLTFAGILAFFGTRYGLDTGQVSPASGIPMEIPYLSVGVGGILMSIKILCLLVLPPATVASIGANAAEDAA
jgi:TRAP-type C4-dicarboxylate transport system permease small subunit